MPRYPPAKRKFLNPILIPAPDIHIFCRLLFSVHKDNGLIAIAKQQTSGKGKIKRIHHECEVGIEKFVPRITVWHHEAC